MSKILNVVGHPIDLDDGRVLAPGEQVEFTSNPHNDSLLEQGHAVIVEPATKGSKNKDKQEDDNS